MLGRHMPGANDIIEQSDPHAKQPLHHAGPDAQQAPVTLIFLHGRGSAAQDVLRLYDALDVPTAAALAPQAAGNTWYPNSFLAPIESNQPFLDSALRRVDSIIARLLDRGIASDRIALIGFSQGACLAAEYAARHPRRYGAIIALTGGLIGPPGTVHDYPGSLDGTPIFLGTSDPDPHVPVARVEETADAFQRMGGQVELRRYPGMGHTINDDELAAARALISRARPRKPPAASEPPKDEPFGS
jgi:predicted esterase